MKILPKKPTLNFEALWGVQLMTLVGEETFLLSLISQEKDMITLFSCLLPGLQL